MAIEVKTNKKGQMEQSYTGADAVMQGIRSAGSNAASFVGGAIGAVKRAGGAVIAGAVKRGEEQDAIDNKRKMTDVVSKVGRKNAERVFGSQAVYNAMDGLMQ